MATVTDALMDAGDNLLGLAPCAGTASLLRQPALCLRQSLLVLAEEARVPNVLAVGQRGEGLQANVNADFLIGRRQDFGPDLAGEAGVPLVLDAADGTRFDVPVNRAVQADAEIAYLGEPQAALHDAEAALRVGDGVALPVALDAREAWRLPRLDPAEGGVEGEVYAGGDVLQDLGVDRAEFGVFLLPARGRGLLRRDAACCSTFDGDLPSTS